MLCIYDSSMYSSLIFESFVNFTNDTPRYNIESDLNKIILQCDKYTVYLR